MFYCICVERHNFICHWWCCDLQECFGRYILRLLSCSSGSKFGLGCRVVCKGPSVATQAGFGDSLTLNFCLFFNPSGCCCWEAKSEHTQSSVFHFWVTKKGSISKWGWKKNSAAEKVHSLIPYPRMEREGCWLISWLICHSLPGHPGHLPVMLEGNRIRIEIPGAASYKVCRELFHSNLRYRQRWMEKLK